MRVFAIGGTGAIGRAAVRSLVAAGHSVQAIARTPQKADDVRAMGAEPITVSIFDRGELTRAFAGHDAIVNLATAIPTTTKFVSKKAWAENDRVRIEGSAAIADAALAAGVGRLLQESVVMLYPDSGDEWINESVAADDFPIARGNLAAESNATGFTESGGAGVILRFGWFYGPGATHSEEFLAIARRRVCVQMGRANTFVSSIHTADAGTAVVAALDVPASVYNVVDDEPLTKRAYADALANASGKRPLLRFPGASALLLGKQTTGLTRSVRASNQRFKDASGWSPRYPSAREGWLATAAELS